MKSDPRVSGDKPLTVIGYKYRYHTVLGFIAMKGGWSTEPGEPYLSHYPDNYSNVSICTVPPPQVIGRYFSACNEIENHNRMRESDIALDKYWLTQSG